MGRSILQTVAEAIGKASSDDPYSDSGKIRNDIHEGLEKSAFLAQAALNAIDQAGFKIVPKDVADT